MKSRSCKKGKDYVLPGEEVGRRTLTPNRRVCPAVTDGLGSHKGVGPQLRHGGSRAPAHTGGSGWTQCPDLGLESNKPRLVPTFRRSLSQWGPQPSTGVSRVSAGDMEWVSSPPGVSSSESGWLFRKSLLGTSLVSLVVKTLPSNVGGVGLTPGRGDKMPYGPKPKTHTHTNPEHS